MVKKRLIAKALEESNASGIGGLSVHVRGETALLLSRTNPFKLARKIEKSKSQAPAKPGDISPEDILIKAGPTPLPPGPVIGELQKVKLPAGVQGDKISIMKDTVIVKEGEEITADVAGVLSKLGIEPMEIGLDVVAAWEDGIVYTKDILFVPLEKYEKQVRDAGAAAFNLSININHFTPETVPFLIAKASQEAGALATNADIITPETLGTILAKASAQADAIAGMVKEPSPEPAADEKPEEKPAEEAKPAAGGNKEDAKPEAGADEKPAEGGKPE
jgi:large subunit ribosomal protein L10